MEARIDFHEVTTDPAASNGAVPEGALTGPDDRAPAAVAGSGATTTTTTTATSTTTAGAPAAVTATTA